MSLELLQKRATNSSELHARVIFTGLVLEKFLVYLRSTLLSEDQFVVALMQVRGFVFFSCWSDCMNEQAILAVLKPLLEKRYGQAPCGFSSLNTRTLDDGSIVYKMYRIEMEDSSSCICVAAHDGLPAGRTFRWETILSPRRWLEQRATLLTLLAEQHYPAPRVIPSLRGDQVISEGPWHLLLTTWITGHAGEISHEHLELLGSVLGRLHCLPSPEEPNVGPARWNHSYSIPHALVCMEQAKEGVPPFYRALYRQCQQTLQTVSTYLASAPSVLIHGDCWPPNSVRVGSKEVVLIDWEGAGRGASILDFGSLVLTCQYGEGGRMPRSTDPARVSAVVSGYRTWYHFSSAELEILPEAVRFRIAWTGSWMIARLAAERWSDSSEESFERIQLGLDLAGETTQMAQACLMEDDPTSRRSRNHFVR
jgi:Ser/Thr protein kinase RdoA (MazF antagonist)